LLLWKLITFTAIVFKRDSIKLNIYLTFTTVNQDNYKDIAE